MADRKLSKDAQGIIDAGVLATEKGENVERAVESAIGQLFLRYAGTDRSETAPINALQEVAVLCVEQKVRPRYAAA